MTDELENQVDTSAESTQTYEDYIKAINDLKASTVTKSQYDALKEENRTLLNNLINGTAVSAEQPAVDEGPSIDELRKDLFGSKKEFFDIDYVSKALKLREKVLDSTGKDIFVGSSHSYSPTTEDYAKGQRVADVFQQCIDASNGRNDIFMAQLQSRMNDTFIPKRSR